MEFERRLRGDLPASFGEAVSGLKRKLAEDSAVIATRKASQGVLEVLAKAVPELVTGSADLTPSNNTKVEATPEIGPSSYAGRYIHWGVREHGMAAAVNGIALHGGFIPSGASFLTFSDYCRPALRLSALMGIRAIEVFTHDSIGLGEDGPTHQPVEHLAALRAIPNLLLFRPADQTETLECWQLALETKTSPSILALTRQNLPPLRHAFTPKIYRPRAPMNWLPRMAAPPRFRSLPPARKSRSRSTRGNFWPSGALPRGSCRCRAWNFFCSRTTGPGKKLLAAPRYGSASKQPFVKAGMRSSAKTGYSSA